MVFTKINLGQWDMLLSKLKEISAGIDCKIPYGRTMLHVLVKTGLQYQEADNQKVFIKSPKLVAWRYKYLINAHKYHENGYSIVYLDETGFVSHDTVRMHWSDSTKTSSLSEPPLRGKWMVKCHAGKSKSFLEYSKITFNVICGLPWWYEQNCIWGLTWEHVNCKFTQTKESNDSDGKCKISQ